MMLINVIDESSFSESDKAEYDILSKKIDNHIRGGILEKKDLKVLSECCPTRSSRELVGIWIQIAEIRLHNRNWVEDFDYEKDKIIDAVLDMANFDHFTFE